MDQIKRQLEACEQAARLGGAELLAFRGRFQVHLKGTNDFVTDADIASQKVIFRYLHDLFPDYGFVGEESIQETDGGASQAEHCWIVDPLDGTLNYIHQLPSYSVSVALRQGNRIVAGAVFDPWLNELYSASLDSPARLNGDEIRVSPCTRLQEAMVVISLSQSVATDSPEVATTIRLLTEAKSVRRLGSAALNLCYVAAGRLDAYWASNVRAWDIAAGWIILEQAGGFMRDLNGQVLDLFKPRFAASCSRALTEEIETIHAQSAIAAADGSSKNQSS